MTAIFKGEGSCVREVPDEAGISVVEDAESEVVNAVDSDDSEIENVVGSPVDVDSDESEAEDIVDSAAKVFDELVVFGLFGFSVTILFPSTIQTPWPLSQHSVAMMLRRSPQQRLPLPQRVIWTFILAKS